jgi:hypothetical protein
MFGTTLDRCQEVAEARRRDLLQEAREWRLVGPTRRGWRRVGRRQRTGVLRWLGNRVVRLGQSVVDRHTRTQTPIEMH